MSMNHEVAQKIIAVPVKTVFIYPRDSLPKKTMHCERSQRIPHSATTQRMPEVQGLFIVVRMSSDLPKKKRSHSHVAVDQFGYLKKPYW